MTGNDSRPDQVVESLMWIRPYELGLQAICGRCSALPHNWKLRFEWGPLPPTLSTTSLGIPANLQHLPEREDWWYLFDNVNLIREYIPRYVPSFDISTLLRNGPILRYTRCHFSSVRIGSFLLTKPEPDPDKVLLPIPNTQWILWYGRSFNSDLGTPQQPDANPIVTDLFITNAAIREYLAADSHATPAGNEFGQPVTFEGWTLALIHDTATVNTPDAPDPITQWDPQVPMAPGATVTIQFTPYALYHLKRPVPPVSSDPTFQPTFASRQTNLFSIVHNPLALPPHTVHLTPF